MSAGRKLDRGEALELARKAREILAPCVARLELAGSLRRGAERVGDVEFVATPVTERDFFGNSTALVLHPLRKTLRGIGTWVKGGTRMMQIRDVLGREGFKLEVYLVSPPAEWGSILAIRTGPKDLSAACVSRMLPRGLSHSKGRVVLRETGETLPTPREEDFFRYADVPFVAPEEREDLARTILADRLSPPRPYPLDGEEA